MNIETGEIRPLNELTDKEKASGQWVKIPKRYLPKPPPTTAGEYAALNTAQKKRERKKALRAVFANIRVSL